MSDGKDDVSSRVVGVFFGSAGDGFLKSRERVEDVDDIVDSSTFGDLDLDVSLFELVDSLE